MKLPDCASNIDVKSAFNFWDPIFILGVMVCQRGAGIKKHPVYIFYLSQPRPKTYREKTTYEAILSLKLSSLFLSRVSKL